MMTDGRQENAGEKDIWVKLAKDNLASWMLNWMAGASLEVIGSNILGAAHEVNAALNKASFIILPPQLKDVPDISKYKMCYYGSFDVAYAALFDPAGLQSLVEQIAAELDRLYATGKVVQGSVRALLQAHHGQMEACTVATVSVYYIKKEE
jgi:hypothetical protein